MKLSVEYRGEKFTINGGHNGHGHGREDCTTTTTAMPVETTTSTTSSTTTSTSKPVETLPPTTTIEEETTTTVKKQESGPAPAPSTSAVSSSEAPTTTVEVAIGTPATVETPLAFTGGNMGIEALVGTVLLGAGVLVMRARHNLGSAQ